MPEVVISILGLYTQSNSTVGTLAARNYYHWSEYFPETKKLDFLVVDRILFTTLLLVLGLILYIISIFVSSEIEILRYYTVVSVVVMAPFVFWVTKQK